VLAVSHVLMALALLAGYAVFLFIRPQKPCRRCRGWGARGRRRKAGRRCGGTGTRFRLGARLVHRGAALAMRYAAERLRERRD
jgi:hypothetical protein